MSPEIVSGRGKRKTDSSQRPLSELVAQGWEVRHYSAVRDEGGMLEHCFHLARQGENKVLWVRNKVLGGGLALKEIDL